MSFSRGEEEVSPAAAHFYLTLDSTLSFHSPVTNTCRTGLSRNRTYSTQDQDSDPYSVVTKIKEMEFSGIQDT